MELKFIKMHGLGNDFVVIDRRDAAAQDFTAEKIIAIADRRRGVGCDQVLLLEAPKAKGADIFMRIYNPDGSEAGACGNGTRCVASLYMQQEKKDSCVVETVSGRLRCRAVQDGMIEVDMGVPRLKWNEIPLAEERDTLHLGIMHGRQDMPDPVAVNVGNPHVVFFVDDVSKTDIARLGPEVENNVLFPERTNVEFVQVLSPEKMRLRVWERGAGVTLACGSGACAAIVAAARRGLTGRRAEIVLDGGSLFLEWRESDDHILMTGPVKLVYRGSRAG